MPRPEPAARPGRAAGPRAAGHHRARHRHHQGRADPRRIARFGERFSAACSPSAERRYVRERPETFAGRWAAKEAVSKVLGLGRSGHRLEGHRGRAPADGPAGRAAARRAAQRAEQLGMGRIALSITHESDYAIAIAFGVRTAGGRYLFPLDIDERLDDRERLLLGRLERLRSACGPWRGGGAGDGRDGWLTGGLGFGRARGGSPGAGPGVGGPAGVDDRAADGTPVPGARSAATRGPSASCW